MEWTPRAVRPLAAYCRTNKHSNVWLAKTKQRLRRGVENPRKATNSACKNCNGARVTLGEDRRDGRTTNWKYNKIENFLWHCQARVLKEHNTRSSNCSINRNTFPEADHKVKHHKLCEPLLSWKEPATMFSTTDNAKKILTSSPKKRQCRKDEFFHSQDILLPL